MGLTEDAAKGRFRDFVARALDQARTQGLTDLKIHDKTGVTPSTFHRWKREGWRRERPKIDMVEGFCRGLGIPLDVAYAALGTQTRGQTEPEPAIDPDMRTIMRKLNDPNVPDTEKWYLRETLRDLARRPDRPVSKTG